MEKINKFLTPIAILVAGLIVAGVFFYVNQGKVGTASPQAIAQKAMDYINQNLLQEGTTASLVDVVEESGLYKFRLKIGDKEYNSYVTKDGKLLWPQDAIDLSVATSSQEGSAAQEIPKTDKPDVKLFVMSYCPFGLQAEKMFLPAYNLLKDKAEMGIYFVNYIMHGKQEIDENLKQYCVQKEEKGKYSNYLSCFAKDGNSEKCLSEAEIDRTKLSACISETDAKYNITSQYNDKSTWLSGQYPQFNIYSDLNGEYGIQGSPTVVINDQVVEINPRSPEKFKETICQAFNSQPAECSQTLSNDVPSSGFGSGTGSSTGGGCGQ